MGKEESGKKKRFKSINRQLTAGAILSIVLVGGSTVFASQGSTAIEAPKICVTAEWSDNSKIKSERGFCGPNGGGPETPPEVIVEDTITKLIYKCKYNTTEPFTFENVSADSSIIVNGDGETKLIDSNFNTEAVTFKKDVVYEVTLDGKFDSLGHKSAWNMPELPSCLREIESIGEDSGITKMTDLGVSLTSVPSSIPSTVTDLSFAFRNSEFFNDPDVSLWDTSNVTNLNSVFYEAYNFNQPLNNWSTSNVTDMSAAFNVATSFDQPLNNWNTSKVTNMQDMFYAATSFNHPIGNWDTSNVTSMKSMFYSAESFDQPLNEWNTSKVTSMLRMFTGATVFNQPINSDPATGAWNTSNVTNMEGMFGSTGLFNQPISNWNTSNVKDMKSMFNNAAKFNQPINSDPATGAWNTSNVEDMNNMFSFSEAFNQPIDKWDTSNVGNIHSMFREAKIFNQDLSGWKVTNAVVYGDFNLESVIENKNLPNFN